LFINASKCSIRTLTKPNCLGALRLRKEISTQEIGLFLDGFRALRSLNNSVDFWLLIFSGKIYIIITFEKKA